VVTLTVILIGLGFSVYFASRHLNAVSTRLNPVGEAIESKLRDVEKKIDQNKKIVDI